MSKLSKPATRFSNEWFLTRIVRDKKRNILETYDHDLSNAEYIRTTLGESDPAGAETVEVIVTKIHYVNGTDKQPTHIKRKDAIESPDVPQHVKVALRHLRRANQTAREETHANTDP